MTNEYICMTCNLRNEKSNIIHVSILNKLQLKETKTIDSPTDCNSLQSSNGKNLKIIPLEVASSNKRVPPLVIKRHMYETGQHGKSLKRLTNYTIKKPKNGKEVVLNETLKHIQKRNEVSQKLAQHATNSLKPSQDSPLNLIPDFMKGIPSNRKEINENLKEKMENINKTNSTLKESNKRSGPQIIKDLHTVPTNNDNATLNERKDPQNGSHDVRMKKSLKTEVILNQLQFRSCLIENDLNMLGETLHFRKLENMAEKKKISKLRENCYFRYIEDFSVINLKLIL